MSNRFYFALFVLFVFVTPFEALAKSGIWDLEMDFQYTEDLSDLGRLPFEMKLCNVTDHEISFVDRLEQGKFNYVMVLEFKDKNGKSFIQNDLVANLGYDTPLDDSDGSVVLSKGECKFYRRNFAAFSGVFYLKRVLLLIGGNFNEDANSLKDILSEKDLKSLLPVSFRIHVTFFDKLNDKAKKGVHFQSDWFNISEDVFTEVIDLYSSALNHLRAD